MLEILFGAECAHVIVPEASEQAIRYYESGNILWIFQQAWAFIIPLLFLVTGFTGKLANFSEKAGKKWFFGIAIYLVLFIAIYKLLSLPLDYYTGYIRQHEYGLSTQSSVHWLSNYGMEALVGLVGAIAFVWIFYLLLKRSPKRWWFHSSLVTIGILFIITFVQPIWIDPLFNRFEPMKDKKLEQEILHLASRAGISHGRVFEVDKSGETSMLNAYVTGVGKTGRIVLWDTTIKQMKPDEILFVMGHEMGHYVLHHIWFYLAIMSASTFAIFYLTYRSANFLLRRYQKKFGIKHLYSIASLPLLLLVTGIFLFLASPFFNYLSRHIEHEADRFGLEITQNNDAAGRGFLILQQGNLANPRPGPVYTFWRASHPSLGDRVDFCNSYCPWKEGKPLKYARHFEGE